jgi:hypothetical protein
MTNHVPFNPKDIMMNQTSITRAIKPRGRRTTSPRVARKRRNATPDTHLSKYMESQFQRWLSWIEDHSH